MQREVFELEQKSEDPSFWADNQSAGKLLVQIKRLRNRYEPWQKLEVQLADVLTLFELATEAEDESLIDEIESLMTHVAQEFLRLTSLERLKEEADPLSAFVTIHAGAGGTEACDWVRMLYRMYDRYAQRKGFAVEVLDIQEDEGGFREISLRIDGDFSYGFLKGETGIHRLVRISPFDSAARRHTSFASVYVSPVLDDTIEINIKPDDIRVDTYRASGAGGQKVNKTSSAVRLTHFESGIVVTCQNERSQFKNKDIAFDILKSRLYDFYKERRDAERASKAAEKKDIGFGHQTRNYVFQPYTMVKDVRTKAETTAVSAVMDGEIDIFIDAYLEMLWAQE